MTLNIDIKQRNLPFHAFPKDIQAKPVHRMRMCSVSAILRSLRYFRLWLLLWIHAYKILWNEVYHQHSYVRVYLPISLFPKNLRTKIRTFSWLLNCMIVKYLDVSDVRSEIATMTASMTSVMV